jgi:hypothetical protein
MANNLSKNMNVAVSLIDTYVFFNKMVSDLLH